MKLTLRRYSFLLFFQFAFLLADLFFNSFSFLFHREKLELTILMFATQDIFIIFEYLLFTYSVHSTCVYEMREQFLKYFSHHPGIFLLDPGVSSERVFCVCALGNGFFFFSSPQVGASHVILRNCKLFLVTILTYFLLSASQHFWIIYNCLQSTPSNDWPFALSVLSFMQSLVSFVYYYVYKRTALTISDPRYYEGSIDWIADQLSDK